MPAPIRLVLDTNTVMALWFFEDPTLMALRAALDDTDGPLLPLCRDDTLEELRRVLAYRQFAIPPLRQAELLSRYTQRCQRIGPTPLDAPPLPQCRDGDDQKFLELARDGHAALLISRDRRVLKLARHRWIRPRYQILTPEAWCEAASARAAGHD